MRALQRQLGLNGEASLVTNETSTAKLGFDAHIDEERMSPASSFLSQLISKLRSHGGRINLVVTASLRAWIVCLWHRHVLVRFLEVFRQFAGGILDVTIGACENEVRQSVGEQCG